MNNDNLMRRLKIFKAHKLWLLHADRDDSNSSRHEHQKESNIIFSSINSLENENYNVEMITKEEYICFDHTLPITYLPIKNNVL